MRSYSWKFEIATWLRLRASTLRQRLAYFQKTDNWDWVKGAEGMRFRLRDHKLSNFRNVIGNRSIVLCWRVRQAIRAILDCFHKAIVLWADHFLFLFFTLSMALAPILITSLRAGAISQNGWFRDRCLQTTVRLRGQWQWMSILLVHVVRLYRAVTVFSNVSITASATRSPCFGILVQRGASKSW